MQRYSISSPKNDWSYTTEDTTGEWVKWEDVHKTFHELGIIHDNEVIKEINKEVLIEPSLGAIKQNKIASAIVRMLKGGF